MLDHLAYLGVLLVLAFMAFQDFRYRGISWYAFNLLALLLLFVQNDYSPVDCTVNIGFVVVNYLLITLLFSLKYGKFVNILDHYLGLGDILMFICLALYLPTAVFLGFYFFSLLLIVTGSGIYLKWKKPEHYTVPLAGLQGLMLVPLIGAVWSGFIQLDQLNDKILMLLI